MLLFILIFSSLLKLIIFSRLDISLTDLSLLLFTICSVTMVFLTLPVSSNLEYTVSFLVRAFTGVIKVNASNIGNINFFFINFLSFVFRIVVLVINLSNVSRIVGKNKITLNILMMAPRDIKKHNEPTISKCE